VHSKNSPLWKHEHKSCWQKPDYRHFVSVLVIAINCKQIETSSWYICSCSFLSLLLLFKCKLNVWSSGSGTQHAMERKTHDSSQLYIQHRRRLHLIQSGSLPNLILSCSKLSQSFRVDVYTTLVPSYFYR
jgi:hypothetical protein